MQNIPKIISHKYVNGKKIKIVTLCNAKLVRKIRKKRKKLRQNDEIALEIKLRYGRNL